MAEDKPSATNGSPKPSVTAEATFSTERETTFVQAITATQPANSQPQSAPDLSGVFDGTVLSAHLSTRLIVAVQRAREENSVYVDTLQAAVDEAKQLEATIHGLFIQYCRDQFTLTEYRKRIERQADEHEDLDWSMSMMRFKLDVLESIFTVADTDSALFEELRKLYEENNRLLSRLTAAQDQTRFLLSQLDAVQHNPTGDNP